MLINLLPQPAALLAENGEIVTIAPSGTVARIVEDLSPAWTCSWPTDSGHTPPIRVQRPRSEDEGGQPSFLGLPTEPGSYIVPAQFADALARYHVRLAPGVELYTPMMLLFPGQPGHPGDVKGPVAPGLIRRA